MTSIPSPIRKWVRRYITGEGSTEVADQSPVQSVNSQTGDVTISTGGGAIPSSQTVTSYSDLPLTDLSEAEIWFVTGESDIVASTQLSPVEWRSLSDFTIVARGIPDSVIDNYEDDPDGVYESSETIADYYGGDTDVFAREDESNVSFSAINGSTLLQSSASSISFLSSTSGLNAYPSQGDNFRCYLRSSNTGEQFGIMFFTQDADATPGGFALFVEGNQNDLRLDRLGGSGSATANIGSAGFSPSADTWYYLEVRTATDDTIDCEAFDLDGNSQASFSVTDGTYTSGGVGFRSTTAASYDAFELI